MLCPECRLPETIYSIKNEVIHAKCAACGAKSMMPMGHKLCTYILSQNKKNKKSKKDKESKKDRKVRRGAPASLALAPRTLSLGRSCSSRAPPSVGTPPTSRPPTKERKEKGGAEDTEEKEEKKEKKKKEKKVVPHQGWVPSPRPASLTPCPFC